MKLLGWRFTCGLTFTTLLCVGEAEIIWQEDFESPQAQDDWYSDFGIWEIAVPTYGPPANSLGSPMRFYRLKMTP